MTEEEINAVSDEEQTEKSQQPPVKAQRINSKRDIFRFKGPNEDMSLNLEHIYQIVKSDKRITFIPIGVNYVDSEQQRGGYVDFETDEAASQAIEQILAIWSGETVENNKGS